jgi:hypothetical protein
MSSADEREGRQERIRLRSHKMEVKITTVIILTYTGTE